VSQIDAILSPTKARTCRRLVLDHGVPGQNLTNLVVRYRLGHTLQLDAGRIRPRLCEIVASGATAVVVAGIVGIGILAG
jgi:hypothetical protein